MPCISKQSFIKANECLIRKYCPDPSLWIYPIAKSLCSHIIWALEAQRNVMYLAHLFFKWTHSLQRAWKKKYAEHQLIWLVSCDYA